MSVDGGDVQPMRLGMGLEEVEEIGSTSGTDSPQSLPQLAGDDLDHDLEDFIEWTDNVAMKE